MEAVPMRALGGVAAALFGLVALLLTVLPLVIAISLLVVIRRIDRSTARTAWLIERWLERPPREDTGESGPAS